MERMDLSWLGPGELRRFTRGEFDRLVGLGMFADERIELLHGFLVAKEPQGPEHADVASRLHRIFLLALDTRVEVRSHSPLGLADDSEPEPDVAVVPKRYESKGHPSSAYLLVEVARNSLLRDRGVKAELYASAGVPEYWVVNLESREVEVRTEPANGTYASLRTYRRGDTIRLSRFPDVTIPVNDFLPAA